MGGPHRSEGVNHCLWGVHTGVKGLTTVYVYGGPHRSEGVNHCLWGVHTGVKGLTTVDGGPTQE